MLILPAWAMLNQIFVVAIGSDTSWIELERWLLVVIGMSTILLKIWMIGEALICWKRSSR